MTTLTGERIYSKACRYNRYAGQKKMLKPPPSPHSTPLIENMY